MAYITLEQLKSGLTQTSTKLKENIDGKANVQHTHEPSDITTDATHRFVTDEQITNWNNAAAGEVTVDASLSENSTNPVQNKVINAALSSQNASIISINSQIEDLQERDTLFQQSLDNKAGTSTASTTANGLMSKEDKIKLNGIAENANSYNLEVDSMQTGTVNLELKDAGGNSSTIPFKAGNGIDLSSSSSGGQISISQKFSPSLPLANGTASKGTAITSARGDHVHPAQTTISGNAGTATTLQNSRTIKGMNFNGSTNVDAYGTTSISSTTITVSGTNLGAGTPSTGWEFLARFTSDYTQTTAYIKISGSSYSKNVTYRNSTTLPSNLFKAYAIYHFVYTGSYWDVVGIYPHTGMNMSSAEFAPLTIEQLDASEPGVGIGFKKDNNYYGYIGMNKENGQLQRYQSTYTAESYTIHDQTTIQNGAAAVGLSGSGSLYTGSKTVTFGHPYYSVPSVVCTATGSIPDQLIGLTVSNITTDGFTINLAKKSNATTTVQWISCGV